MRFSSMLLAFLLVGCASSAEVTETKLNAYAQVATKPGELSGHLAGAALESALGSLQLMNELGLISSGSSEFSQTEQLSDESFSSCLDVSGTQFFSSTGEPLVLDRIERQLVRVELSAGLITELELQGQPC